VGVRVIAVLNWRPAVLLKDNQRFLERAGAEGRVRPRDWRAGSARHRSLTLREDGSCEVQKFSTAAAVRRLGGVIARAGTPGARVEKRG
jgi:hypothetical protein